MVRRMKKVLTNLRLDPALKAAAQRAARMTSAA
jgi:hypothetical protein